MPALRGRYLYWRKSGRGMSVGVFVSCYEIVNTQACLEKEEEGNLPVGNWLRGLLERKSCVPGH